MSNVVRLFRSKGRTTLSKTLIVRLTNAITMLNEKEKKRLERDKAFKARLRGLVTEHGIRSLAEMSGLDDGYITKVLSGQSQITSTLVRRLSVGRPAA